MDPVLFFRSDVCLDDELSFVEMFAVRYFFEMTTVDIGSIGGGAPGLWEGFLRAQTLWTGGWGWGVVEVGMYIVPQLSSSRVTCVLRWVSFLKQVN